MDRRVRKTQAALYSALVALVVERGYDAISVQDIIEAADVGRTTFYAHFKSRDELLMFGFQQLRGELLALLDDPASKGNWGFIEPLLEHARRHFGLYRALLGGNGGRIAERAFQTIVEEMVARELAGTGHGRIAVAMLAGALVGAVRGWIEAPAGSVSVADVASTFRLIAGAQFRHVGP